MNCPYCGGVLEGGTLFSTRGINWVPDGVELPLGPTRDYVRRHGGISLYEKVPVLFSEHPAFVCRTCGKMLLDVKREKTEEEHG